jgi:hypothetical protein
MDIYLLGIIFVFACTGLFFVLNKIARSLIRSVLVGKPFNKLYLNYLRATTKYEFDAASTANNSDRAWNSVVFEKVYEIGVSGVPFSAREKNLEYIKAQVSSRPRVSRKLADELIKVLPKQYGNMSFQTKLACYICELLRYKDNGDHDENNAKTLKLIHVTAIDHITTAISAWIAGSAYLILSINVLDNYSPVWVAFSSFVLFILMVLPLINLIGTKLAKLTTVGAIASIIVLFLGIFATIAHGKTHSPLEVDLNPYQNPNAKITIRSPEWLTINNVDCGGKKISVSLIGQLATPIRFHVDNDKFKLVNKDCLEIVPQLDITQTEIQAYEFYVAARDSSPFYSGIDTISVTQSYISASGERAFNSNAALNIRLEHWLWGLASNMYVALGSVGGTILLYLINYFVNKRAA